MALQAGKLNKRGIVKAPPETLDSRGQRDKNADWTKVAVVWFSLEPAGGSETETAKQQHGTASYELRCHYTCKIKREHRIEIRGKTLEVSYVENVGMNNRELRILASEVT